MSETEKIIFTAAVSVVATLCVAVIGWYAKRRWDRKEDTVSLSGKLSMSTDYELMQRIGCPGMVFTVVCTGKRQARIKSAHLCLRGEWH